jgi:hypothetical protein
LSDGSAARGCLLGLMVGDAIGATGGRLPVVGTLPANRVGERRACVHASADIRFSRN